MGARHEDTPVEEGGGDVSPAEVTANVSAWERSTPPMGEEQQGASESGSVSEGVSER